MAIVNCTECGSRISDKAIFCPLCGSPEPIASSIPKSTGKTNRYPNLRFYLLIVFVFSLLFSFIGCMVGLLFMTENIPVGVLIVGCSIMYAISTCAFIELINVLLDIEKSVRFLRKNG